MHKKALTIGVSVMRMCNYIMVVKKHIEHEIMHVHVDHVVHGYPQVVVTRRSRAPILPEINEKIDMIADEV